MISVQLVQVEHSRSLFWVSSMLPNYTLRCGRELTALTFNFSFLHNSVGCCVKKQGFVTVLRPSSAHNCLFLFTMLGIVYVEQFLCWNCFVNDCEVWFYIQETCMLSSVQFVSGLVLTYIR